ncbi:hypothetical protein GS451_21750 [Rhodococcus hoagii]|nr:hypothetical protein [Prescottella equi]
MAAVPVRCTGWAHGAGGRVAQRRSVEGRVVLAERVSKLPDFGRGGAWRIESHPDVLSSGWSGVGAQVLDPKVGQVRGDSIGVEPAASAPWRPESKSNASNRYRWSVPAR